MFKSFAAITSAINTKIFCRALITWKPIKNPFVSATLSHFQEAGQLSGESDCPANKKVTDLCALTVMYTASD